MRTRQLLAAVLLCSLPGRAYSGAQQHEPAHAAPEVTVAAPRCDSAFMRAAAEELRALQRPADCATARLLVLATEATHFEGMGSVLMAVAEALAEAHAAARTLVLGPPRAQPALLREARCADGAAGWACPFEPLGPCDWRHVSNAEAAALPMDVDSCSTRVKASTATRGAGALYAPPPHLAALLPPQVPAEDAGECWAAAVLAQVARPRTDREAALAARRAELFGDRAYIGAHLRVGDTAMSAIEYGGRVYTNKPSVGAEALTAALPPLLQRAGTRDLYLATDAVGAREVADAVAEASGARVALLSRFRTPHGSHTAAFATSSAVHRPLLPAELLLPLTARGGRYEGDAGRAAAAADQDAVRYESLEDLYLLSHASALIGTASSHFSVAARLWGLARGAHGPADVAWMDADGVASGVLATGYMHGQLNTTFALQQPERRAAVATQRLLDEPLPPSARPGDLITFHRMRCVPLVPRRAMRRLRATWSCAPGAPRADDYVRRCVDAITGRAPAAAGECASAADLLNAGVDFHDGFNAELAFAAWRAVMELPEALSPRTAQGERVADVARENLAAALGMRRQQLQLYLPQQQDTKDNTAQHHDEL